MFCTSCGHDLGQASGRFCPQCGQSTGFAASYAAAPRAPKRLFRIRRDGKIAGVCAGLAHYVDIDVTLIRILWIVALVWTVFVPAGLAYLIAWVVMPVEETASAATVTMAPNPAGQA